MKTKLKTIFNEHLEVAKLLNDNSKESDSVSLELHDFSKFFLITGRKSVLEFMTDGLKEAWFIVSEPKLITFFRKDGDIVADMHVIKVHVRLHDGQPIR